MSNFLEYGKLSDCQLEQAMAIAQYDIHSAARYCKAVAARNAMKCPICGGGLVRSGGSLDNYICQKYRRGGHVQSQN